MLDTSTTHPELLTAPSAALIARKEAAERNKGEIWWSNGIFFIGMHVFAVAGVTVLSPVTKLNLANAILCFVSWQLASFGITIGQDTTDSGLIEPSPLRCLCESFWPGWDQWDFRVVSSGGPYDIGYITASRIVPYMTPTQPRRDSGTLTAVGFSASQFVSFQHRHYVPIALFSGLILPALIAKAGWNDWMGGLVWGGAVARLLIWHTTFCINSLAHWTGIQPYTEEVTARGNYFLALLTSGEGNHNYHHAFPKDFRNGPHPADWDPSKWFIWILHRYTSLVPTIFRTSESAIHKARARVFLANARRLTQHLAVGETIRPLEELPVWSRKEISKRNGEWVVEKSGEKRRRVLLMLEGCVVDVGGYLEDHPGGEQLLLSHSVSLILRRQAPLSSSDTLVDLGYSSASPSGSDDESSPVKVHDRDDKQQEERPRDATRAFFGGMNNHSEAAREMMRCLRVARVAKGA
ncbi:hypothetical protein M231_05696 [Tremella mesenterica]|uniref:Cytochrome b5 heme-binding domain-containing protein n=1 Tax=Tremella mesenterica TaxID=5217 RepID=A0A4V1M3J0_TREME|nr:hypothetical protein M231_05696 [Tremella mesenterica]